MNRLSNVEIKYNEDIAMYKRKLAEANKFVTDVEASDFASDIHTQSLVLLLLLLLFAFLLLLLLFVMFKFFIYSVFFFL
jgi:hypothetical protein